MGGVFRDSVFHDLTNDGGRQGLVSVEPDCALARAESLEIGLVSFHCRSASGKEGTVPGRRAEEHQHLPIKTESRQLIADAFFSPRGRGFDGVSQLLERRSFVIGQPGEVVIVGCALGCHASNIRVDEYFVNSDLPPA